MSVISVRGASEHNLRDVSVDIPKGCLVAFTGVSGSGKSSLVFETIYAEAFRRFADASTAPMYVLGSQASVLRSRPSFQQLTGLPPALGLSQRQGVAGRLSTVGTLCGVADLLRVYFAVYGLPFCRHCEIPLRPTSPEAIVAQVMQEFSGRTVTVVATLAERRKGAFTADIERFRKLGYSRLRINGELVDLQDAAEPDIDARRLNTIEVLIDRLSIAEGREKRLERAVAGAVENGKGLVRVECEGRHENFNTKSSCPQCGEAAPSLDPRHFSHSSLGRCGSCEGSGASSPDLPADLFPCESCKGARISPEIPEVRVKGRNFQSLMSMPCAELLDWIALEVSEFSGTDKGRSRILDEALRVTTALVTVGLGHLPLCRAGGSLSPGDLQRIRLASIVSNRMHGALYVMDEPCQGLTSREVDGFLKVVRELVHAGGSVLVVEHHPAFLSRCDVVFTMGPGAGVHGGRVVAVEDRRGCGPVESHPEKSETSSALADVTPMGTRSGPALSIRTIAARSLKMPDLSLRMGALTLLRGPSGRGKSTLLNLCLAPALESVRSGVRHGDTRFCQFESDDGLQVLSVETVSPGSLVRTSRRAIAAALEILPPLRTIFASLPQSQILGLTEAHFSWASAKGRCEECEGRGVLLMTQRSGATVELPCERCLGARLGSRSLVPRYKGYNFAEIMQMSIEEAQTEFANFRLVASRLAGAMEFGLGYLQLGQSLDSLSGGELQRLILTLQLRRSQLEGVWYLLSHPCTGLHTPDIRTLGALLMRMTAKGASFVAIENREEFVQFAHQTISL